jgi:hypothetical protein
MSFMHYQNSTTHFHRVCIQSGIVKKNLGFEARCYIIVIYLNVGYNIAIYERNVGKHGEIYEEEKVDGECREIQDDGV